MSVLASIVVFCTTYALILPAITMNRELICTLPEHTHDEACQADGCAFIEHIHEDICYKDEELRVMTATDGTVDAVVQFDSTAEIPEDAILSIYRIWEEDEAYNSYFQAAQQSICDADEQIKDFYLYDIAFYVEDTEIEPQSPVSVQLSFSAEHGFDGASQSVVHFLEDAQVELPAEQGVACDEEGTVTATFNAESFSRFAVVTKDNIPVLSYTENMFFKKVPVTSAKLDNLAGNYLIAHTATTNTGGVVLPSMRYDLVGQSMGYVDSAASYLSSASPATIWTFSRAWTNAYYISTVQNGTTYYLCIVNGSNLGVTTDYNARTAFTVSAASNGNLGIYADWGSDYYINKSGSSANFITWTQGPSADPNSAQTLFTPVSAVTFDGTLGGTKYYEDNGATCEIVEITDGRVTLPDNNTVARPDAKYPYSLKGWYDVVNNIYYDRTMLGQTIETKSGAIFYAEWESAHYDFGAPVTADGKTVIEKQIDTSSFITTHVFDYNDIFNVQSAVRLADGSWSLEESGNDTLNFVFKNWAYTVGQLGRLANENANNADHTTGTQGSIDHYNGQRTPGIINEELRDILFSPEDGIGKTYLGTGNMLYQYDTDTGYFYYHNIKNAASYNQTEQRFYVYNELEKVDHVSNYADFLPFNDDAIEYDTDGTPMYDEKDGTINYWFGFSSKIHFYLPFESGNENNVSLKGDNMIFRFAGDDDVLVYVDDTLVLDLAGVHDITYGEIDFTTGKIAYGEDGATNTGGAYGMPGVNYGEAGVTVEDMPALSAGDHTLTIYYMERGSSLSNCAIYFNMLPRFDMILTKRDLDDNRLLDGAVFGVYIDPACTVPATLYPSRAAKSAGEEPNHIYETVDGVAACWGFHANQTYYIKELEPPDSGTYPRATEIIKLNFDEKGVATMEVLNHNTTNWDFVQDYAENTASHIVSFTVYNQETSHIEIQKTWENEFGVAEEPPADKEISVSLYRSTQAESFSSLGSQQVHVRFVSQYFDDASPSVIGSSTDLDTLKAGDYTGTVSVNTGNGLNFTLKTELDSLGIYSVAVNGEKLTPTNIEAYSTTLCTVGGHSDQELPSYATYHIDKVTENLKIAVTFIGYTDNSGSLAHIVFLEGSQEEHSKDAPQNPPELVETIVLNQANNWSYQWDKLPNADINHNPYYYYAVETPTDGYDAIYMANGIIVGQISISNLEQESFREFTEIAVEKQWSDGAENHTTDEIVFRVIRHEIDDMGDPVLDAEGNPITFVMPTDFVLHAQNDWKRTIPSLLWKVYDNGIADTPTHIYKYTVEEVSGIEGYNVSYIETTDPDNPELPLFIIKNTNPDDEKITVTKRWFNYYEKEITETDNLPTVSGILYRNYISTQEAAPMVTVTIKNGATTLQNLTVQANSTVKFWAMLQQTYWYTYYNNPTGCTSTTGTLTSTTSNQMVNGATRSVTLYSLALGDSDAVVTLSFSGSGTVHHAVTESVTDSIIQTEPTEKRDEAFQSNFLLSPDNHWTTTWSKEALSEEAGREYRYYVTETVPNGYSLWFIEGDGIASNTPQTPIVINNKADAKPSYVLPATGGTPPFLYTFSGIAFILAAFVIICIKRHRRERRAKR